MSAHNQQNYKYIGLLSNSAWFIFAHRWDVILFLIKNDYRILIIAPADRAVPAFDHPSITYVPVSINNKSLNIFASIVFYSQLKKIYRQYEPIISFHYAIKANTFGNLAAKGSGTPCVSVIVGTGHAFSKKNWLFRIVKAMYAQTLKIAVETWFLNKEDADFFIQQKIVNIKKVRILNGEGINTAHFNAKNWPRKQQTPFTFIITTRILYSKGIQTIADAIRILKTNGKAIKCLLLGDSDKGHPDDIPENVIDGLVQEGIFEHVPFVSDVRPWLVQSDCFLLPSYYNEGLPRCLMEAASMELPIITSNQKGCKETVLDGVSGFLCPAKDAKALAKKMDLIMQMPEEQRLAMGRAGRQFMQQRFSVDKTCAVYLEVIKKIQ